MVERNPWYKPLMRELRAGRLLAAEAARLAGVSRERIRQWCKAAGFDPAAARERRVAQFYAREMLKMSRRDYGKLRLRGKPTESMRGMAPFMAPLITRPKRAAPAKAAQRAELDGKVVDFIKAGGKIKRLKPKPRDL